MAQHAVPVSFSSSLLILVCLAAGAAEAQQILLVSPGLPTTADEVSVFLTVVDCGFGVNSVIQGNTVYLVTDTSQPCPPLFPPDPGHVTHASFGPLGVGSYTIVVKTMAGQVTDSRAIFVSQPSTALSLFRGRYAVTVSRTDSDLGGAGQAVQVSDAAGYFWFFDKDDVEIAVKMVDGTELNGHVWVFIASATTLPFTLSVVDTWLCSSGPMPGCAQTYQNPPGINRNFIDLTSFSRF